jgi:non-ribosomal peptide synthase protein (TIGR01720 family)
MHPVEILSVVHDHPDGPRLTLTLRHRGALLTGHAAQELLDTWSAALAGLAAHTTRPDSGGHTPADFALVDIDQAEIDVLENELADDWGTR